MNDIVKTIAEKFFGGMTLTLNTEGGVSSVMPAISEDSGRVIWHYRNNGVEASITATTKDGTTVFAIDAKSELPFLPDAASLPVSVEWADATLASYHDNPYWMIGNLPRTSSEISDRTQSFIFKANGSNLAAYMLVGDLFSADAYNDGLRFEIGCGGIKAFSGPFLAVATDDLASGAMRKAIAGARTQGAIAVPLRCERRYPAILEGFGWCTWNTFYQKVDSAGIYRKLDEFASKKIPIRWVIIDDGWQSVADGKMTAFEINRAKFPEGLSETVARIKRDYGVRHVGVWHSMNAYWNGIDPDSALAREYADCLVTTACGMLVPSTDPEKGFRFWDGFHAYLESCGVDFVKVDNQSSTHRYFQDTLPLVKGARGTHEGIERSIARHFGGCVIDCMGMDNENVLSRPYSAVSRNSDDFYPDRENGFGKHIRQNVYSALWHSCIHFCDYDMWWSGRSAPVQSGLLRAISGGPVYVSDAMDESDNSNIVPVVGADGDICRLDEAAIPTEDCIYVDCENPSNGKLLKIWNRKGAAFALAAFNIAGEEITERFTLSVIPALECRREYLAYEYFSKKWMLLGSASELTLSLPKDGVAAYSFYPVENGKAFVGDTSRYVGIGCRKPKEVDVATLL